MSHFWRSLLNAQGCLVFLPKLRFFDCKYYLFCLWHYYGALNGRPWMCNKGRGIDFICACPCAFASVIAYTSWLCFQVFF